MTYKINDILFLIGFNSDLTLNDVYQLQINVQNLLQKDLLKMSKKLNNAALKRYNKNLEWLNKYKIIINLFYKNLECKNIDDICKKYDLYKIYFSK